MTTISETIPSFRSLTTDQVEAMLPVDLRDKLGVLAEDEGEIDLRDSSWVTITTDPYADPCSWEKAPYPSYHWECEMAAASDAGVEFSELAERLSAVLMVEIHVRSSFNQAPYPRPDGWKCKDDSYESPVGLYFRTI